MDEINNGHKETPLKVAVIGSGNVATHLCKALEGKVELYQVDPRSLEGLPEYADIAVISVKDDAIKSVARRLDGKFGLTAHTSGSVPMSALADCGCEHGVFYPLQTFTKDVELNYSEIPFFIEGSSADVTSSLSCLAHLISGNVREADSDSRKTLHLASVFACNFSNCLVGIADDILRRKGMDYSVLLPLLSQTLAKLQSLSPKEAQTGPAARLDMKVVNSHVQMLNEMGERNLAGIYEGLSAEIIKKTHPQDFVTP